MTDDLTVWLRRAVEARKALALGAIELGNLPEWTEPTSGVLVTTEPTASDIWYGTWALGDSTLSQLMAANDPQDTIARCEAELAILDDHAGVPVPGGSCPTCIVMHDGPYRPKSPCKLIYMVAAGYRHWPGYQAEWVP
jgi:hypothetical protein